MYFVVPGGIDIVKKIFFLHLLFLSLLGCDPERKKKCEWYLVPDLDRTGTIDPGYIPVCARNYIVNKQDCRLQATLEFARDAYNKKFRLVDLKVKSPGIPRTVTTIDFSKCK